MPVARHSPKSRRSRSRGRSGTSVRRKRARMNRVVHSFRALNAVAKPGSSSGNASLEFCNSPLKPPDWLLHLHIFYFLRMRHGVSRVVAVPMFQLPVVALFHKLYAESGSVQEAEARAYELFQEGDFQKINDQLFRSFRKAFAVNEYVCSPNIVLNQEGRDTPIQYTTCPRECVMYHWTNLSEPESDEGWYHLHSNPFWRWSGTNLHIITVPIGAQVVAMNKYSEFNPDKQVQAKRREVVDEQVHPSLKADTLRVFDAFDVNNTHREFRLPDTAKFKNPRGPFANTYHSDRVGSDSPLLVYYWTVSTKES